MCPEIYDNGEVLPLPSNMGASLRIHEQPTLQDLDAVCIEIARIVLMSRRWSQKFQLGVRPADRMYILFLCTSYELPVGYSCEHWWAISNGERVYCAQIKREEVIEKSLLSQKFSKKITRVTLDSSLFSYMLTEPTF